MRYPLLVFLFFELHPALFRVDATQSRFGRAFRIAPVARQTNPYPVWLQPRFSLTPLPPSLRAPFPLSPFRLCPVQLPPK